LAGGLLALVLVLVAMAPSAYALQQGDGPGEVELVNDAQVSVRVIADRQELANALADAGLSDAQVMSFMAFDSRVDEALRQKGNRGMLLELTSEFNASQQGPSIANVDGMERVPLATWTSSVGGIYASCLRGPRAHWRTYQGSWNSAFRTWNGTYYWLSGSCSGSYCDISRTRNQPGTWAYHLAVGYSPYHFSAGCW
jgi:hypothetical protein